MYIYIYITFYVIKLTKLKKKLIIELKPRFEKKKLCTNKLKIRNYLILVIYSF